MLVRSALARLRAQAPRSSARDVAHISRQLAHTYLKSSTVTTQLAIAPAVESFRAYATATRTKPKPKAKATTKKSPAKKTATRKTAAKKPVKKRAVKKPVKKTVKKKVVKKAAPKRRGLTERQKMLKEKAKEKANIAQLKELDLEEPKKLPANTWALYVSDFYRKQPAENRQSASEVVKKAVEVYKTLSASEKESIKKQAQQNRVRNEEEYAKWLRKYTPKQILEANKVRVTLARKVSSYRKKKIQDDRLVKGPKSPYLLYHVESFKRPDLVDLPIREKTQKVASEWKAMSASQKQKYEDASLVDRERYDKEYKSLYGEDPPTPRTTKVEA